MHPFTPWTVCALIVIAALAPCSVALAVDADLGDRSQRARIQTERRDAQVRFNQQMATCSQQFVAAACQDSARSERRATLDALRHQQLVLDDDQRRQRAAARLRSIQGKTAAPSPPHDEPALSQPAASASASARRERLPRTTPAAPPNRAAVASAPRPIDPSRSLTSSVEAERRRQQSERRASDSDRHRLEVGQRNAERDRKRPPAAGLPAPASSP